MKVASQWIDRAQGTKVFGKAGIMVSVRNPPHGRRYLNTRFPLRNAIWENYGTFRRRRLAGGSVSPRASLKVWNPT